MGVISWGVTGEGSLVEGLLVVLHLISALAGRKK